MTVSGTVVHAGCGAGRVFARHDGVEITHVFETHIHGDYVTGGYAPARAAGAEYLVNAEDPVSFARTPLRDGDDIDVGRTTVRVLHTPGHTFTHLSYAVAVDGAPVVVFTGGSLLHGAVGRPELVCPEHARALAPAQWNSVHRLVNTLPEFHADLSDPRRRQCLPSGAAGSDARHGAVAQAHRRRRMGRGPARAQGVRSRACGRQRQRRAQRATRHLPGMARALERLGNPPGGYRG
ncbi:hypothetical protein GCM10009610_73960 [Pseudonocardia xinjiangensis]